MPRDYYGVEQAVFGIGPAALAGQRQFMDDQSYNRKFQMQLRLQQQEQSARAQAARQKGIEEGYQNAAKMFGDNSLAEGVPPHLQQKFGEEVAGHYGKAVKDIEGGMSVADFQRKYYPVVMALRNRAAGFANMEAQVKGAAEVAKGLKGVNAALVEQNLRGNVVNTDGSPEAVSGLVDNAIVESVESSAGVDAFLKTRGKRQVAKNTSVKDSRGRLTASSENVTIPDYMDFDDKGNYVAKGVTYTTNRPPTNEPIDVDGVTLNRQEQVGMQTILRTIYGNQDNLRLLSQDEYRLLGKEVAANAYVRKSVLDAKRDFERRTGEKFPDNPKIDEFLSRIEAAKIYKSIADSNLSETTKTSVHTIKMNLGGGGGGGSTSRPSAPKTDAYSRTVNKIIAAVDFKGKAPSSFMVGNTTVYAIDVTNTFKDGVFKVPTGVDDKGRATYDKMKVFVSPSEPGIVYVVNQNTKEATPYIGDEAMEFFTDMAEYNGGDYDKASTNVKNETGVDKERVESVARRRQQATDKRRRDEAAAQQAQQQKEEPKGFWGTVRSWF